MSTCLTCLRPKAITRTAEIMLMSRTSGEQTATALEANLTSLESKLDELLASFEGSAGAASSPVANGQEEGGSDGKSKADR